MNFGGDSDPGEYYSRAAASAEKENERLVALLRKVRRLLRRARSIDGEGCKSANVRKALEIIVNEKI